MANDITVDEWLREISRLESEASRNDDGFTTQELVELTGLGEKRIVKLLKASVQQGKVTFGTRIVPLDWDGRRRIYKVYRFRKEG